LKVDLLGAQQLRTSSVMQPPVREDLMNAESQGEARLT
jgi:hypothetical protein